MKDGYFYGYVPNKGETCYHFGVECGFTCSEHSQNEGSPVDSSNKVASKEEGPGCLKALFWLVVIAIVGFLANGS